MEIEIICRETIKPSSPTPHHLRTHKLSLLDQLAPSLYIPIVLFYSPTTGHEIFNRTRKSVVLKDSLSKTLTHFYPFGGRIKDIYSIDCNDDGATYIETQINSDVSFVLKEPGTDLLLQLLPCDPFESPAAILAVQVNYFGCGGMAIGVCIRHVVADASATASFLKTWAAMAKGIEEVDEGGVVFDCTRLFPPQNVSGLVKSIEERGRREVQKLAQVVTKRYVFDGSKIASLRNEMFGNTPTRVEAVSSLIWNAVIKLDSTTTDDHQNGENFVLVVNMRNRMNPPLPKLCIGNIYHTEMVNSVMTAPKKTNFIDGLAEKVHESIKKIDDEYIRQMYGRGELLNSLKSMMGARISISSSSWCRFPFYETDFGWGKPLWFGTPLKLNKLAILLDSNDGKAIEAWIGLPKDEMKIFEKDPGILAYASLNPAIL